MADIFVSYTSKDRDWAFWIGQELEKLGHVARLHDWEVSAGGNIMAWMDERHHKAERVLCVVSSRYLEQSYSVLERHGAQWAAASSRPNFLWPVFVEACEPPTLLAPLKRCDLHGLSEVEARARLAVFLQPAARPTGPVAFPGTTSSAAGGAAPSSTPVAFPGRRSNIPISVPRHFLGRDDDLAAIGRALNSGDGRAAISALHGLRGVGKTTLAAAYAERHREAYRATWWIRAETGPTMRADLVGLGVQMGWVPKDVAEEPAVAEVLRRLRDDGEAILLIYDNAISPSELDKYLPRGGKPHIVVTSNAPNWGRVAAPVEIEVWPKETGADFLIARTRREAERDAALVLSEALGGLPLAHDQAAAYCERIGISLSEYKKRFETAPASLLDKPEDASREYHDGLTAAKTFTLAIGEAAKRHPAAEPLIVYASLLAPEPIPLFLFSEGRLRFAESFSVAIAGDGLDEAIGALRAFALVDREQILDERDPTIRTDCIRVHRLVRQVAASRRNSGAEEGIRRDLTKAITLVYPRDVYDDPATWPRARRLDAIAHGLVDQLLLNSGEHDVRYLLDRLAAYRHSALAAFADARLLYERALAIAEKTLGPEHLATSSSLNDLAGLLKDQGDLAGARQLYERALAISEKTLGPDHHVAVARLSNLGALLHDQGDLSAARRCHERALEIRERTLGAGDLDTAMSLNNLGAVLRDQGDLVEARRYQERALAIREKELGPNHLHTANSLSNVGLLLQRQGDYGGAMSYFERALAARERAFGLDHPEVASIFNNLGSLMQDRGDIAGAQRNFERALAIREKRLGSDHPDTARSLNSVGTLLRRQGDLASARDCFQRATETLENKLGLTHPHTLIVARNAAVVLDQLQLEDEAAALRQKFGLKDDA